MGEQPKIELDVNDFNEPAEVEQETTPAEASPAETKEPETKEEVEPTETEGEDSEADKGEEPAAEETKEAELPIPERVAARQEQLNTEIRELVSRRNELRQEVAKANSQAYQPQAVQELVDLGWDPVAARVEALEQRTQMAEYNAHVADINATLSTESLQVMKDFPVFDPNSPDFDKSLSGRVAGLYQRAAAIQTDPKTNMIVNANVTPYDFYKAFAETHSASVSRGQVAGQKSAEKMLANAETTSSAAPKQAKEDPFLTGLMKGMKTG